MTTITDGQARRIASEWHGGQWSALYSLASTGAIIDPDTDREIADEIGRARDDDPQNVADLRALLAYVIDRGPRGRVPGWADLWSDAPAPTADFAAGMLRGYLAAASWTATDDEGEPLDPDPDDLANRASG